MVNLVSTRILMDLREHFHAREKRRPLLVHPPVKSAHVGGSHLNRRTKRGWPRKSATRTVARAVPFARQALFCQTFTGRVGSTQFAPGIARPQTSSRRDVVCYALWQTNRRRYSSAPGLQSAGPGIRQNPWAGRGQGDEDGT